MADTYRVTWEIDVDAETPDDAARAARAAQLRGGTTALIFDIGERRGGGVDGFHFVHVASVDLFGRTVITPEGGERPLSVEGARS